MLQLIDPEVMRSCESAYFATGAARSIDVMESAAQALADAVTKRVRKGSVVRFACGSGGNGGDGYACARLLSADYRCEIVMLKTPKTPDAIENHSRALIAGVPMFSVEQAAALPRPDVWVDALFGTGFSGAVHGDAALLTARMNADRLNGSTVFSADIPSGLNGKTGAALKGCVMADVTVTFGFLKTGLVLADGLDCCGEIVQADVGFPEAAFAPMAGSLLTRADSARLLPQRPRNTYKNACGHLLIVAGSVGMAGALVMCVRAALRTGAGLVTAACPASVLPIVQTLAPQAMCIALPEENGAAAQGSAEIIREALAGKTAAVVGCGLTQRAAPEVIRAVLESPLPAVVDADALNLIAKDRELRLLLGLRHVLTPHIGEASRLLKAKGVDTSVLQDPMEAAKALGALGATVLLKGASCVSFGAQEMFVSASGCAGMARGGAGDILSGILGALLCDPARKGSPALTAALASEIHGVAGEWAQKKYSERGMNAADILEGLPEALRI